MPITSMKMPFSSMKSAIALNIYSAYLQVLIPLCWGRSNLKPIKGAYIQAYSAGCTGTISIFYFNVLSALVKVRTNTGIANTPVSVSYTAVNLAEDSLDKPLSEATVLILGAGTMSELTATHLQAKGVKTIFVS